MISLSKSTKPSSSINVSPNQMHSYMMALATYNEFCTKDVYTDRNSKEYIATRKIKTISGMLFSNYGNTVKNI